MAFNGFPREGFAWFEALESDNSRAYFAAHRETFERSVREPLEELLETFADEFGGRVKVFRQHRDVRFSRDKSPYKTRTYGVVTDRPDSLAGLYAQLSASGFFVGSGYHQLEPDQLARFREAIADDRSGPQLEQAVNAAHGAKVETFGEVLKTAPRGYPKEHPRVGLLRHKALFGGRRLDPGAKGITPRRALDHARATWEACGPMNAWLDEYVGASREGTRPRR
jgi:uncharacterized protein (TIGR02453 family)